MDKEIAKVVIKLLQDARNYRSAVEDKISFGYLVAFIEGVAMASLREK